MSHLKENNQSYWGHNKDALEYSRASFRASIYFFIHAFFPDRYTTKGSREIAKINNTINMKKDRLNEYLMNKKKKFD